MGRFVPDTILERIRQAVDIVSLVRESVPLKKSGSSLKGLCPFHREKTPSFMVNPERQIFKCFGCGVGGNVFSFVMKIENIDFPEAVRILAERAHIELPEAGSSGPRVQRGEKTLLFQANRWAAEMFHKWLISDAIGREALKYLADRGVTRETITGFQLGYAPEGWSGLLDAGRRKGFALELMAKAGLLSTSERREGQYDRFRNRLMFPIRDVSGRVIGFGARALDNSEPKYLNSPETPLFTKGRTLYGLDKARDALKGKRRAIVVEGYMDVIMAHQYGVPWIVGVLGTALTRDHVRLLRRYVDEAVLVLDPDSAGRNSADRSIDAFAAEELSVSVVTLANGLDPDEFLRRKGVDAFVETVEAGIEGITYKLNRALDGLPPNLRESATSVARALDDVLATIAMIPNTVTQSLEINKVSERTGVPESALRRRIGRLASARRFQTPELAVASSAQRNAEQELLEAMLTYPATIPYVRSRLKTDALRNADIRELVTRLQHLAESSKSVGPAELLAVTQEPDQRTIVEKIIGGQEEAVESPEAWCRDLIARLEARRHEEIGAEIHRRIAGGEALEREAENQLAEARLRAAREAQRTRGKLHIREHV